VKRSNRLVILVGVLLAIVAFVAIVIVLNSRGPTASEDVEVTEAVLVTTEDLEVGEALTPDKVVIRQIPPEAVQGTPLRDPSQVDGRPSRFAIAEGTQVTLESITSGGTGTEDIAAQLQVGEKSVAVRLDDQTGVNFLVQPGDYVDIIISAEVGILQPTADSIANPDAPQRFEEVTGLESARTVKTVLQDKRVLYVSGTSITPPAPPTSDDEGEAAPPPAPPLSIILVFAGTDQEAELVKFVQRDRSELSSERFEIPSSISVVIRHAEDDEIETTTGVTIDSLFEEYGVRVPAIVEQLNEEGAE
jgi:Flp pilus assembly protein CpaB